jgi:hypothetical protein
MRKKGGKVFPVYKYRKLQPTAEVEINTPKQNSS